MKDISSSLNNWKTGIAISWKEKVWVIVGEQVWEETYYSLILDMLRLSGDIKVEMSSKKLALWIWNSREKSGQEVYI